MRIKMDRVKAFRSGRSARGQSDDSRRSAQSVDFALLLVCYVWMVYGTFAKQQQHSTYKNNRHALPEDVLRKPHEVKGEGGKG